MWVKNLVHRRKICLGTWNIGITVTGKSKETVDTMIRSTNFKSRYTVGIVVDKNDVIDLTRLGDRFIAVMFVVEVGESYYD